MKNQDHSSLAWMDILWLVFLAGLAVLQPILEIHKQLVLLGIGIFQLAESRFIALAPRRGRTYAVLIKILLATLLMEHTSTVGINSSYYPIYYLPVVTAAIYFGPWATLLWTGLASAAYCSLLLPALEEYELTASGISELAIRILFFFLAGILVNRFVTENLRQMLRYQALAETLADTNRRLERAEAEARRSERLAALGQLSAGLAHEIRNPLGVIKGSAEMLDQNLQDAGPLAKELAGNISGEVNRMSALIARFMDFARPSQLEPHLQEIAPLVDRALKAVHDQYPGANVTVEREYASDLPKLLLDEALCEQVFINLGLNAYEAMALEGGRLRVSIARAESEGHRRVEVSVEDSGPGIPAELREEIFNPFVTTKRSGAGLGLSIVSKIVDDHGGSIRLTSKPGKGACFRISFPVEGQ
ncbi:MAG TPA: ATP-binding protein [Candidatus Acidoferrales bacterium]|nr:ATP-binding protein [Candidatus Acidoferrales bacterium]